jgi:hypothetical protein
MPNDQICHFNSHITRLHFAGHRPITKFGRWSKVSSLRMFWAILSGADVFEWGRDLTLNAETMTCDLIFTLTLLSGFLCKSLFHDPLIWNVILSISPLLNPLECPQKKLRRFGTPQLNVSVVVTVVLSHSLNLEPSVRFKKFVLNRTLSIS